MIPNFSPTPCVKNNFSQGEKKKNYPFHLEYLQHCDSREEEERRKKNLKEKVILKDIFTSEKLAYTPLCVL